MSGIFIRQAWARAVTWVLRQAWARVGDGPGADCERERLRGFCAPRRGRRRLRPGTAARRLPERAAAPRGVCTLPPDPAPALSRRKAESLWRGCPGSLPGMLDSGGDTEPTLEPKERSRLCAARRAPLRPGRIARLRNPRRRSVIRRQRRRSRWGGCPDLYPASLGSGGGMVQRRRLGENSPNGKDPLCAALRARLRPGSRAPVRLRREARQ